MNKPNNADRDFGSTDCSSSSVSNQFYHTEFTTVSQSGFNLEAFLKRANATVEECYQNQLRKLQNVTTPVLDSSATRITVTFVVPTATVFRCRTQAQARIAKSLAEDPERWKSFQVLVASELSFRTMAAFRDAGHIARMASSCAQDVMQKTTQAIVKQIEACDTPEKLTELIKALKTSE